MDYAEQYRALSLDGTGSARAVAPELKLDGSVPFTLDVMVRGNPVRADAAVLHQDGALDLKLTGKGFSFWREGFGSFSTSGDASEYHQDEWNHLCVSYEPGTVRLFVNGALNQVASKACQGSACANPFVIGDGVQGEIRQIRLFKRALGGAEVQDLLVMGYDEARTSPYADALAAWYDFCDDALVERVARTEITLHGNAKLRALFPGARLLGNAYLAIPNESAINPAGKRNDAYSVQSWINFEPFEGQDVYTIFANGDQMEEAGMSLYVARDGANWRLGALRGDEAPQLSLGTVKPGTWTNVCLTYDGLQTQSLYIDGTLDSARATCLPISDSLQTPNLRIGADLSQGDDNGKDCFVGTISRLDVWGRALTAVEVATYANEEPAFDAEGLLAAYDLGATDINNVVSTDPLGLRNGVVIAETVQDAEDAPPLLLGEAVSEPLDADELQRCRAACLGNDEPSPLRVSRLEKGGTVYFIGHYRDGSSTMAIADADLELDDWTLWYIELVLLLLGGALAILAGISVVGGNKITNFIVKHILTRPALRALFAGDITFKAIITFFYLLKGYGLIKPLLKCAMTGMGWFKTIWTIGVMITMAVAIAIGLGLVYYATVFADLVVSLAIHLANMPSSGTLLPVNVTAVFFDHHAVTSTTPLPAGEADGVALSLDGRDKVPTPEWSSSDSWPCAYSIAAVTGKKITVKTNFSSSDSSLASLKVRVLDKSSTALLGNSDEATISFRYGASSGNFLGFPAHKLPDRGVGKHTLKLEWQCYHEGAWKKMALTQHTLFTLLGYPNEPWLSRSGHFPWVPVLEKACSWAASKKTANEVAGAIEAKVNADLGLSYDIPSGAPHYYNEGFFLLNDFLLLKSKAVNCMDCAMIVATFANALGCDLYEARMHGGYTTPFKYVPMKAIGKDSPWSSGAFRYHEVAVRKKDAASKNQNRAVYDACCTLNGSATPEEAAGRIPLLANGINFSDYDDGLPYPYPTPALASYREHFAMNDATGIGCCRYDWSSETRRQPLA